ncbi:hypothetical protein D3C81_751230 [compost metagenome]
MQAGSRVQHQIPRRQFHLLHAVGVLDHQFTAVVVLGVAQEQRRRQVGTHSLLAAAGLAQGVVDMEAEIATLSVTVDQRWKDFVRQGRRHELRVLPQTFDQGRANLLGQRMAFRQLQVVLGLGRLVTRGDLAVGPFGLLQRLTNALNLLGGKQAGNR